MVRAVLIVLGVVLLVVGAAVAENWKGSARRIAIWAVRPDNRITRGRGPYRMRNIAVQTVAHRVYGGVTAVVGLIILTIVVRH